MGRGVEEVKRRSDPTDRCKSSRPRRQKQRIILYELLEKHNAALCLAESEKLGVPKVITAPFVYIRLRMPDYTAADRTEIAQRARRLLADGRDVYAFFNHEESPAGARYAEELVKAVHPSGPR